MAVYVDDMEAPFGQMIMCHMMADTHEELIEMVRKIGVDEKWIQFKGTSKEHFDVSLSKRRLAMKHGAKEITWLELATKIKERKDQVFQEYNEIIQKAAAEEPINKDTVFMIHDTEIHEIKE